MALITYDDKQAMGIQPTIPAVNKVTDSDMNEIKAGINGSTTYSTSEIKCGTWIDGKPIYRKVINFGELPNTSSKSVNHNISNLGGVRNLYGICYRSLDGLFFPLPSASTTLANNIQLTINGISVNITTGIDRTNIQACYVIVEYTKTTD